MSHTDRMVSTQYGNVPSFFKPILDELASLGHPMPGHLRRGDKKFHTRRGTQSVAFRIVAIVGMAVRCEMLSATVRQDVYVTARDHDPEQLREDLHHSKYVLTLKERRGEQLTAQVEAAMRVVEQMQNDLQVLMDLQSEINTRVELEARILIARWEIFRRGYSVTEADREVWNRSRVERMRQAQTQQHLELEALDRQIRVISAEERLTARRERRAVLPPATPKVQRQRPVGRMPALRRGTKKKRKRSRRKLAHVEHTCPNCKLVCRGPIFFRWHGTNGEKCRIMMMRPEPDANAKATPGKRHSVVVT